MDLKDLLNADLSKAAEEAKQAAGNTIFSFLGNTLENKATDAGIELKTNFVPKVDKPEVASALDGLSNQMMLVAGVAIVGLFLIFKSK